MKIKKTKGNKRRHMVQGLLSIIDGLLRLITFGFFWSNLEYTYVVNNLGKK